METNNKTIANNSGEDRTPSSDLMKRMRYTGNVGQRCSEKSSGHIRPGQ